MSSFQSILATYRSFSKTEREKGSYFEDLIRTYFRNELRFADFHFDLWLFGDWAKAHSFPPRIPASTSSPTSEPPEPWGNPKYSLELFLLVVTVGLETVKVVNGLPKWVMK